MTTQQSQQTTKRTDWFVHDRFGLFIHWGIYAAPARHEWIKSREMIADADYQRYFDHFDPDLYDPASWAAAARDAGAKYSVITSKHHDGFCLWDSAITDYKAPNTPAGRDLLSTWVDAFRAEGLKTGFYHSLIDWRHPEFPLDGIHPQRDDPAAREESKGRDMRKYVDYLHGQVRELLTMFGKIDVLWPDFSYPQRDWGWSKGKGRDDWQSERLIEMARQLQPDILINNRADLPQDFYTPEQIQPREGLVVDGEPVLWEACQTLNGSWGYDRDNLDWKSPEMLVQMLVDAVSKGGNMLLNVGPTARGEFDDRALQTLKEIGVWMRRHSRAIYGCGRSEFVPPPDCRYTYDATRGRLYLHLFAWPFGRVELPGLRRKVEYAQLLNDASEVRVVEHDRSSTPQGWSDPDPTTLMLQLPVQRPPVTVPVIELFLKD